MDHLGAVAARPENIPYVVTPAWEYDNQGFAGFPKRKGLDIKSLIDGGKTDDLQPGDLESFAQAWLFFGLLGEFSVHRPCVQVDFFVKADNNGRQIITTEYLLKYLGSWRQRMLDMFAHDDRRMSLYLARMGLILQEAKSVIIRCCSSTGTETTKWKVSQVISLSFMILGETLEWAISQLQNTIRTPLSGWVGVDNNRWGSNQLLVQRMLNRRWCPHSISMLQGQMKGSISGLYYASSFPDPPDSQKGRGHRNCTADECTANAAEYKARHVADNCQCPSLQPDINQIAALLENGEIPLIRYIGVPDGGQFQVVKYKRGMKFVMVSHVWSDGLGNPEANAMGYCQIARLSRLLARSGDFQGHTIHMWVDSLMVSLPNENVRQIAIRQMADIYSAAHWTVVADADLMELNRKSGYVETAMRITISGWMQRLWTLQEGVMSKSLYFLFKDGLQNAEDLELSYPQAASQSSVASVARAFYLDLIRPRPSQRHSDINLVGAIWKAIQWRRATRASDETLAIARILGINEHMLLDVEEGRMEILLQNMSEIPPGMIFVPGDRLCKTGFRWAPDTWMTGRELEYPDPLSLPSKKSIFPQGYSLKNCYSLLSQSGLMVRYPGFRLHNFTGGSKLHGLRFPVDNSLEQWYNVKPVPRDESESHLWDTVAHNESRKDYAIICCRKPGTAAEIAVLVSIVKADSEAMLVSWVLRVFIQRESNSSQIERDQEDFKQDPERFLWGEEIESDQLWVVD